MALRHTLFAGTLIAAPALFAGAPPGFNPEPEQLLNGDFENGVDGWNLWGADIGAWGRKDGGGVRIFNGTPKWSGADQILALPDGAKTAKISGWMRSENIVAGSQPWETGRIAVEFLDEGGGLVGGYPPVVGQVAGNTPWAPCQRDFPVPAGAAKIKVQCALGNATGSVYCDDMSAVFKNADGTGLKAKTITGPLDYGTWYPLAPARGDAHFVDWSSLLDAPAGKHGWLKPKGDQFAFEDGTPVRFWGVNLVGADVFGSHALADSIATRLSKMGANLVRLHHMDAPWAAPNIFGNKAGTRKLDSASLDRLDYLHAAFKKRGIYIMPDLLVHREMTESDGAPERAPLGAKQVGTFSRKLIELQKEYAKTLLSHVNPYTKRAWKDDPSVAMTEFINESSIFANFDAGTISGAYRKELDSLWKAAGNPGELAYFELDWSHPRGLLKTSASASRIRRSFEFLSKLERSYYDTMRAAVRSTGAKLLLTGTNFPPPILAALHDAKDQDYTISNDYWDHPQIWKIGNDWSRVDWSPLDNRPQLRNPSANLVATKSWFPLQGKPFLVTEWNHCLPNEHEVEALPLVASYASLQGWAGLLQFDFDPKGLGTAPLKRYTLSRSPSMLALWTVAAPLFLRRDVAESKDSVVESIDSAKMFSVPSYSDVLEKRWALPYSVKVRKTFSGKASGNPDAWDRQGLRDTGRILSSTRELDIDSKAGVLRIDAPRVQGAAGAVAGKEFSFSRLSFRVANPEAAIALVSADGKPLASSKRFYLVATGPSKMKGAELTRSRTGIKALGELPVLTQVLEGSATLKGVDASKAEVRPLGTDGVAGVAMTLSVNAAGATIDLSKTGSPVLEITLEGKP
jgi:hypothetical protein